MSMKVYISPPFDGKDPGDGGGGIRRVVEAQKRYLPEFGIEVVDRPSKADLINCHAGDLVDYPADRPMVASCHGLYWSNYEWPDVHYEVNQRVIDSMVQSQHVTAPSRWVAHALRRGILKPITPIHHGVHLEEWQPGENGGYVLWNKARADIISNPVDLVQLAEAMPETRFVTTIGRNTANVEVTGVMPYAKMKALVQNAGVYLATARETFGIGTLEALACGVPVVGWDFGGQREIILQGETGYLVPYGDYEALADAVRLALGDKAMRPAAREDAAHRWQWRDKVAQYADLFMSVHRDWHKKRPILSVIVTCYNLGRFLGDCLQSVMMLPFGDWECVIVDDHSTDDTRIVARRFCEKDSRFIYRETPQNLSLSGARNYGFEFASGRYILPLDADDAINPAGAGPLIEALNNDQSIHIAYGNLTMMSEDASQIRQEPTSPGHEFNWLAQMAHVNQLFYPAMMRREVLAQTGGYRSRDWRAEDAAFWCRATSFGFRAKKVTEEPTIFYRVRGDSKGATERANYPDGDGDWTAWYGWRIAGNYDDGNKAIKKKIVPQPDLVPFGAQTPPPRHIKTWDANHRQEPLISVIIPVGPGHQKYLVDTLDSLLAQSFSDWEAIVVNDTGQVLDLPGHPWAEIVNVVNGGNGAGYARNLGLKHANAPLVLFLDADDWLLSNAMRDMLLAWVLLEGQRYIYTNYISVDPKGNVKHEKLHPYDQHEWHGQHAITVLMLKEDALRIGGFDEDMHGWEDWDFQIKKAVAGICGQLLPREAFVYRNYSGERRDRAAADMDNLLPILKKRYEDYYTGAKAMSGCGCSGAAEPLIKAKKAAQLWQSFAQQAQHRNGKDDNNMSGNVRMEFTGGTAGKRTFKNIGAHVFKRQYIGGNNSTNRYEDVDPDDVEAMKSTGVWRVVERPAEAREGQNLPAPQAVVYEEPKPVDLETIKKEAAAAARQDLAEPPLILSGDATEAAEREAEALGVNLRKIKGTGKGGKITVMDVRQAAKQLA